MRNFALLTGMAVICMFVFGCSKEGGRKDRSEATDMYECICKLTEEYTNRLESAPDSADWAALCSEYEEKLDKICLSYAPDTDLLLTEGQNDTIHSLMQEYVRIREERIHGIMHPEPEVDSLSLADSLAADECASESTAPKADASRSPGN